MVYCIFADYGDDDDEDDDDNDGHDDDSADIVSPQGCLHIVYCILILYIDIDIVSPQGCLHTAPS